jgi:hypothetical protein
MSRSYQHRAQVEMWQGIAGSGNEALPSGPPPTAKQVYALARALAEQLGVEWPPTRAAASALIAELRSDPPNRA